MTWTAYINYRSPFPRRLHIKFGFDRPSGFQEEDVRALWTTDGRRTTDDGRRIHWYTISSPCEPNGSGELKKRKIILENLAFIDFIIYFCCFFLLVLFLFQTRDVHTCLEDFHLLYCLLFFYENRLLWKTLNYTCIMKTF